MTTLSAIGIGTPSITTLGVISTGTWNGSVLGFLYGGVGTNLTGTFSNGGILYSNASNLAIFGGTATANKALFSAANTTPVWSTTVWPATVSNNGTIYCNNGSNNISFVNVGNSSTFITSGAGAPSWSNTLGVSYGGYAGNSHTVYAVLCAGTTSSGQWQSIASVGTTGQVLTSAGASAKPTMSAPKNGVQINQASSSVTLAAGSTYTINNGASLVTLTLPATAAVGDTYIISGQSSGGWTIAQNSGQIIYATISSTHSTSGAGGSVASGNQYNTVTIICVIANTTFVALAPRNSTLTYT